MLRLKSILQYNFIYIILFVLVILISFGRINIPNRSIYTLEDHHFEGILLEYKIDGDKFSFVIKSKEKLKGVYYIGTEEEKEYLSQLDLGITLSIQGTLESPHDNTIPNTFNYKKYLNNLNINYTLNVEKIAVINTKTSLLYSMKNALIRYINTFKSKSYLNTFIVGNKNYLGEGVYENYQALGVSHIFAISGMHISLLSGIILKILSKLKVNDTLAYFLVIVFLMFYIFITNFQASILRSVGLFLLLFMNKKFKLDIKVENILILDISILLLIDANLLTNIGFLYSSIVSFSLIKFNYLIKGNYFMKLFKVSLIAFLASLPITLYNNYEFNILSIINNLFIVPFVSVFLYPLSLITLLIRPLDELLLLVTNVLETLTTKMLIFNIIIPKISIWFIIIYYFLIICLFKSFNKKYLILIVLLLMVTKGLNYIDNNYYVYFLDVGQGDSAIIKKGSECIMIDTGGKISYKVETWQEKKKYNITQNTIKFLKSLGVDNLDYVILTHGDVDHAGEISYLIDNFKVKNVIINKDNKNSLEKSINENIIADDYHGNIPLKILKSPKLYDNENDNSNIILLNAYNHQFLFMGDAGKQAEEDFINTYNLGKIDVLKVGHHGSKTSSSKTFIKHINPKYSIISVGQNNKYGHPNKEVLDNLSNSKIYRTDTNGSIMFKIKKDTLEIATCTP